MTKPRRRSWKISAVVATVFVGIITAVATLVGGVLSNSSLTDFLSGAGNNVSAASIRVANAQGNAVSGAKVLLFLSSGAISVYSDTNGTAVFPLSQIDDTEGRVVVEADQFEIYEQQVSLPMDRLLDIRLTEVSGNQGSVIVRVNNDENMFVSNAEVVLIIEGKILSQVTDANGIAKFDVLFPSSGNLDAEMSVTTRDYEIKRQRVTLLPNKAQDVLLDRQTGTIEVTEVVSRSPENPNAAQTSANLIAQAESVKEVEPNNEIGKGQVLPSIGVKHPVKGSINPAGDQDWYQFDAVSGQVYTIELFDVSNTLGAAEQAYKCGNDYNTYRGLGISISDPAQNQVAVQCATNGVGNVHVIATFTAGVSGAFIVQVFAHSERVAGDYGLRVLPRFDQPGAAWLTSMEPNNTAATAYPILAGIKNPLKSVIEQRNAGFSTNWSDADWYSLVVKANETYVVEIFDVANNIALQARSYKCADDYAEYRGLGVFIFDPAENRVAAQCAPDSSGNVHTRTEFTAGVDGTFFIQVMAHSELVSGNYSIQVLPKYNQDGAAWDEATQEPNNNPATAFEVKPDDSAIKSAIASRNGSFSSFKSDIDWYRFNATAGETYLVEIVDASNTLSSAASTYSCNGSYGEYKGLLLAVFDPDVNQMVVQCAPNEQGSVYASLEVVAGMDGFFYVSVSPHSDKVSGNYSIRVQTQ